MDQPPFTSPFVQIADMDNAVMVVTTVANNTTTLDNPIPAFATIHGIRKNKITPQIFRRVGNKTPLIQPNFVEVLAGFVSMSSEAPRTGSTVFEAS